MTRFGHVRDGFYSGNSHGPLDPVNSSIVTLVTASAAKRIANDVARLGVVRHARGVTEAAHALREGHIRWLVLDPTVLRLDSLEDLLRAAASSGAGVLAHLALTDEGVARLFHILQLQPVEVEFESQTVAPFRVRECLARPPRVAIPSSLLHSVVPQLLRVPPRVRSLLAFVLCAAPDQPVTQRLISDTGMSRRSIDRWLHRSGLRSFATTERVARVARSWEHLSQERLTLEAVAVQAGFGAARTLTATWRATCGRSPRLAGRTMTSHEVLQRLGASLAARPSDLQAPQ